MIELGMLSQMSQTPPQSPITPPPPTAAEIEAERRRSLSRRAAGSAGRGFWGLPLWKKALLALAVTMTIVGIVGATAGTFRSQPVEVQTAQVKVEELRGVGQHSALTAEQKATLDQASAKVNEAKHWFYDQAAPQLWRIGLGFAIAFVLGFMARQFLKTMATLAAIVLVGVGVALYFGYLDAAGVKTNLSTGTGWVMDRLDSAKATLLSIAGTSLSGTVGFVLGFMRSK